MFFDGYLYFETAALVTAAVQYKKIKNTQYKYFLPYLFLIVAYEVGTIYRCFSIRHTNLWITNITMALSFLFYSIFLLNLVKTPVFRKWIKGAILLSIFCSAVNMAFLQGFLKLDTITILLEFSIIIALVCIYFYELMNYSGDTLVIIKEPGFWLNTGLLFFCLAEFLYYSAFAYMAYNGNSEYFFLSEVIANVANAILYSCIVVSLLCFRTTKN